LEPFCCFTHLQRCSFSLCVPIRDFTWKA